MNHNEYEQAARYWNEKDKIAKHLNKDELKKVVEHFLSEHKTCALATANAENVRNTPIEYSYIDGKLYMFSEGGIKFANLEKNKQVCVAVFDSYNSFADLAGVQISGEAEIIDMLSPTYKKILDFKRIPESAIKNLDHSLYLIEVKPKRIEMLFFQFKLKGYAPRQCLDFED